MKKLYKLTLIILVSVLLAGCRQSSGIADGGKYFIQNIVDGDTAVLVGGRKIRYIGIDTPETMKKVGSNWILAPEAFGLAAKDLNQELVANQEVHLEFDVERQDKYGRLLAYVYKGEVMVNLELVRQGYATVYTFPPNLKYYNEFLLVQEEAKRAKRGLWGSIKEILPSEAVGSIGKFRMIRGRVEKVSFSRSAIYLNFGPNQSESLTAVIFAKNIQLFSKEGIEPSKDYDGVLVEVVGKIEDRGGPQMIIDNPSQIKILSE
jgi:endonuclease YncB( thermonuclease family)